IEPTLYGRALLRRSTAIFDDLRDSISEIEYLSDPAAGELRIGALEFAAAGLVPALIDSLAQEYPRVAFAVVQADSTTLKERDLRGRKIELAIIRTASADRNEDLDETVLFSDQLCVVAGLGSPWASRRKIALADLVGERWCLPPPDHPVTVQVTEAFHRAGLEMPRMSATVTSAQVTSNLVAKGHFLGIHGTAYLRFNPVGASLKALPVKLPI